MSNHQSESSGDSLVEQKLQSMENKLDRILEVLAQQQTQQET
jgi:hypothetical protein